MVIGHWSELIYLQSTTPNILPAPHTLTPRPASTMRLVLSALLLTSLTATGCLFSPRFEQQVRLPQLWPRHPVIERRASEYHDPYPDSSIGPGRGVRPLGFHRQRTETRRTAELRGIHLLEPGDRLPSTGGMPKKRYSQVVSPD